MIPTSLVGSYARGEIFDLFAAGADIVQVDEPYMRARPEPARVGTGQSAACSRTADPTA